MLVGLLLGSAAALVGVRLPVFGSFQGVSIALVILALVAAADSRHKVPLRTLRVTGADLAFMSFYGLLITFEMLNAIQLNHSPFLGVGLTVLLAYLATWPARMVITGVDSLREFMSGLTLASVPVSVIAVAQLLRIPGVNEFLTRFTESGGLESRLLAGWDIRGTSTIGHWTALGGYLACISAAACIELLLADHSHTVKLRPILVLGASLAGQVTTLTFATIAVAVAVVVVTVLRMRVRPSLVIVGVGVATGGWLVFGQKIAERVANQSGQSVYAVQEYAWLPQTVGYRLNIWMTETLPAILQRPVTGWGSDVYAAKAKGWFESPASLVWVSPESEWMRTLVTVGVAGLILQVILLVAVATALFKSRSAFPKSAMAPIATLFGGLLMISSLHSHLNNPGVPLILWPLLFAVIAAAQQEQARASAG